MGRGYSHWLKMLAWVETDHWFTDAQWGDYATKAARLIHAWFSGLETPVVIQNDYSHTMPDMFSGSTSDAVASEEKLTKLFLQRRMIRFTVEGCGPFDLRGVPHSYTLSYCTTYHKQEVDPLVVALFALASEVTEHRIQFVSEGKEEDLKSGLNLLSKTLQIEFNPRKQSYTGYTEDPRVFRSLLELAVNDLLFGLSDTKLKKDKIANELCEKYIRKHCA